MRISSKPVINLVGATVCAGIGGLGLTAISLIALKTLGFKQTAEKIQSTLIKAIPNIKFVEEPTYDLFQINSICNIALMGVTGMGLAGISRLGLKALGFNKTAISIIAAVPFTIGSTALVGAGALTAYSASILIYIIRAFEQR